MDENFYHFQQGWLPRSLANHFKSARPPVKQKQQAASKKMSSQRNRKSDNSSDSENSSGSEFEYEPIVVQDAEGNKIVMQGETNPLAPILVSSNNSSNNNNNSTNNKSLLQQGNSVIPMACAAKKIKKPKVFASKDSMLALIESVNTVQDGKIQDKLDRDASYLQRLTNIEKATQERKSMKGERLNKIKDNLRKGGVRVKGENKKIVREKHFKEQDALAANRKKTGRNGSSGPKKQSSSSQSGGIRKKPSPSAKGPSRSTSSKPQKKVKFAV